MDTPTLRLQHDYLLVEELEELHDPAIIQNPYGRHAQTPVRARVLIAGEGYRTVDGALQPMLARVNDIVWLQFGAGTEIRIAGQTYRVVLDRDLFAVEA